MTTRVLARAEWPKLAATELGPAIDSLPEGTQVVVVEDVEGRIVGCWAAIQYVHVEGLWIAPEHRRGGRALAHLLGGMKTVVSDLGGSAALTVALSPDIAALLERQGATALPGVQYVLPLEGFSLCRPSSRS